VTAIVRKHVEDACSRAWAEIAQRFGAASLLTKNDPATASAQQASRALVTLMTNGLSRLALAALVLPSRGARLRGPSPRPKLAAIPGGLRRDGHAADAWRPGESPSR